MILLNISVYFVLLFSIFSYLIIGITVITETRMAQARIIPQRALITVQAGFNGTLSCQTDNNVRIVWHYMAPLQSPQDGLRVRFLYNGFSLNENFTANYVVGNNSLFESNLNIISAQLNHAGTYTCQKSTSLSSASLQLVVIGEIEAKH